MSSSKRAVSQPDKNAPPLLVIRAKAVRMVVASLITIGILGVALIADILGSDRYKAAAAVLIVVLMLVLLIIYYWARRVTCLTLTANYLMSRGWLIRTITIPLGSIRRAHVEERFISTGRGGGYYRDFLIISYDTKKAIYMQISAYHSRDILELLTSLKQYAPQIKFDANIRRFLDG